MAQIRQVLPPTQEKAINEIRSHFNKSIIILKELDGLFRSFNHDSNLYENLERAILLFKGPEREREVTEIIEKLGQDKRLDDSQISKMIETVLRLSEHYRYFRFKRDESCVRCAVVDKETFQNVFYLTKKKFVVTPFDFEHIFAITCSLFIDWDFYNKPINVEELISILTEKESLLDQFIGTKQHDKTTTLIAYDRLAVFAKENKLEHTASVESKQTPLLQESKDSNDQFTEVQIDEHDDPIPRFHF